MQCLFAPWCAYYHIFKDYFTFDGEYPADDNWSTTLDTLYTCRRQQVRSVGYVYSNNTSHDQCCLTGDLKECDPFKCWIGVYTLYMLVSHHQYLSDPHAYIAVSRFSTSLPVGGLLLIFCSHKLLLRRKDKYCKMLKSWHCIRHENVQVLSGFPYL